MNTNCRCCMKNYYTQNFMIEVQNHGSFTARVSVSYFDNGHFIADSSGPLTPGFQYKNPIPFTAYSIVLRVYNLSTEPPGILFQNMYQHPENVKVVLVD